MDTPAIALTYFDSSYVENTSFQTRTIREILADIQKEEEEYLKTLEENRSSYGLYAIGEYDYDVHNEEDRHELGIEWRLFNDGYFESVQEDNKKILQNKLEFYQMRRDMIDRLLEEDLFQLSLIENLVHIRHYTEKREVLLGILEKRQKQEQHGYTTTLDILDITRQMKEAEQNLEYYMATQASKMEKELVDFFNHIGELSLKSPEELHTLARANSYNLKIQNNFIERSTFFPAWKDQVEVNLNALHQSEFSGTERQMIGVEVELPLTFDLKRNSLIRSQQRIYRYQKEAVDKRIQQQTERLSSLFTYQQKKLSMQTSRIALELEKKKAYEIKQQRSIQPLEDDPERILNLLTITIIDSRYEALSTRLKAYEILLKLIALTQAQAVSELFQFQQPHSPVH